MSIICRSSCLPQWKKNSWKCLNSLAFCQSSHAEPDLLPVDLFTISKWILIGKSRESELLRSLTTKVWNNAWRYNVTKNGRAICKFLLNFTESFACYCAWVASIECPPHNNRNCYDNGANLWFDLDFFVRCCLLFREWKKLRRGKASEKVNYRWRFVNK